MSTIEQAPARHLAVPAWLMLLLAASAAMNIASFLGYLLLVVVGS